MKNMFLFIVPSLIWGSTWYAIKFQIDGAEELVSVALRFGLAGLILLAYALIAGLNLKFSLRDHFFIFLQGVSLFGVNYWLVYLSEENLASGVVAVLFAAMIFTNILFSALLLRKPLRPRVLLGAMVGFLGILLIFKSELRAFSLSDRNFVALLQAMGSVVLASLGNILSAFNQGRSLPVVQSNVYGMFYGALSVTLVALALDVDFQVRLSPAYVISLGYLSVFGSVIAFGTYLRLLGNIGPEKAGYISLVNPLIALLISSFFENYHWNTPAIVGVLLILGGNFLALYRRRPVIA
jgi:drug/metabolite transporter (DMT)-like permease